MLIASFPNQCEDRYTTLLSPDGSWLAESCTSGDFLVLKRDGTSKIDVSYDKLFGNVDQVCASASPLHWTRDNRYLYFIRDEGCWESPPWHHLAVNYMGSVFKLDTQTGTWSIFIENDGLDFYSFSPTERRVIQGSGSNLYLHDLKTGDEQSISLNDYVDIGAVVWSPDGLAFAFAAQKSIDPISDPYDYKYSVFLYNIQNQKLKSIITDSLDRRVPQEWTADGILLIPLADYSNDPILGQTLYYNINTLSFVTATPIP